MSASGTDWPALTATPLSVRLPAPGRRADLHRTQSVGRAVVGIAEAEVARHERRRRVSSSVVTRIVGAARGVVDRSHIDGHGPWRDIHVHPTVGRAAVVLHLEGEASVARSIGISRRGERKLPAVMLAARCSARW